MDRTEYVLAVMASSEGEALNAVQVQKLFFILDRKIPEQIGGARFDFSPDCYGPYDADVYREFETLQERGLALVIGKGLECKAWRLTVKGHALALRLQQQLPRPARDYVRRLSEWLRPLSFQQVVSAVYRTFPDMAVNGAFR